MYLLHGRKAMTNLDRMLKSRDITLLTKMCIIKAMVFPVVIYVCESWTVKKAEHWRIDAFELWCWRRLLRVPWTARRSNQSIWKEINPEYLMEGLMLKLKLQSFDHWCKELTHWKRPDAGKDWRQEEKGMKEVEMVGWHHWFSEYEFEQILGDGEGQASQACCSPWCHRVRHDWATKQQQSERSQSEKAVYYMIATIWHSGKLWRQWKDQ